MKKDDTTSAPQDLKPIGLPKPQCDGLLPGMGPRTAAEMIIDSLE